MHGISFMNFLLHIVEDPGEARLLARYAFDIPQMPEYPCGRCAQFGNEMGNQLSDILIGQTPLPACRRIHLDGSEPRDHGCPISFESSGGVRSDMYRKVQ